MFTRATILCAALGLASATFDLINTPARRDFVRRGQGCCRLVEEEIFDWEPPKELVTNEIGRPMTKAKCLDFCINNRTNCRGIEVRDISIYLCAHHKQHDHNEYHYL